MKAWSWCRPDLIGVTGGGYTVDLLVKTVLFEVRQHDEAKLLGIFLEFGKSQRTGRPIPGYIPALDSVSNVYLKKGPGAAEKEDRSLSIQSGDFMVSMQLLNEHGSSCQNFPAWSSSSRTISGGEWLSTYWLSRQSLDVAKQCRFLKMCFKERHPSNVGHSNVDHKWLC